MAGNEFRSGDLDDDPGEIDDIVAPPNEGRLVVIDTHGGGARRGLPLHSVDGPDGDEARDCIVGRMLARGETSLLIAPPFLGKSVLVAHLASYAAAALPWFGQAVPQPTPVLIIAAERFPEMKRRLRALVAEHPPAAKIMVANGRGLDLRRRDAAQTLRHTILEFANTCGSMPGIVVFDTLAKLTPGADEISAADMTTAMCSIETVRDECGFHAVVVHHTPRDNPRQSRGHSSIDGAVDLIVVVERESGHLRWRVTAANSIGQPYPSGEFEIVPANMPSGPVPIVRQITKAVGTRDAAVLAAVKAARGQTIVSELTKTIDDPSFADLDGEARRKAVDRALVALSKSGLVTLEGEGRTRSARSAEAP